MRMRSFFVLLLGEIFIRTDCTTVGKINSAQLVTTAPSIWLPNQLTWLQCLCYALQYPPIVAFNSYARNASCQLFPDLSSDPYQIIAQSNVTVQLLRPLSPYAPCCSNLTWLLTQMQSSVNALTMSSISSVVLDDSNNRLSAVTSSKLYLVSLPSFVLLNSTLSLPAGSQTVNYHQNLFYVGIFPAVKPYVFHIYSAVSLTKVGNMSFTQGGPQRLLWLFNDTLICVLLQINSSTNARANFYNWPSNTLNQSVALSIINAYGLAKAPTDDSFVFISDGSWGGSVWQLKTTAPYNFTLFAASTSINESPSSLTADRCNRLWVTFAKFGVRIYDIQTRSLLSAWNLSATYPLLYDIVLTDRFQLYLADKSSSRLARYGSELECTD